MKKAATPKLKISKPLGNMPVLQFLRPSDLRIDPSYQRSADCGDSKALIRRIAQGWNWDLCLPLVVARRQGMTGPAYFVIDGQHRLEAARVRGDIDQLPCVVLSYASVSDEAANFVALNQQRKPLSKLEIFKAAIASGNEEACAIAEAMAGAGLWLAPHANPTSWKPGVVSNVAGIEAAWRKRGATNTTRALQALSQAFAGQVLQYAGTIFPGIAAVCFDEAVRGAKTFPQARFEKFITMLAIRPQEEWRIDINRARLESNLNSTAASELVIRSAWSRAADEAPAPVAPPRKPAPAAIAPSTPPVSGPRWCDQCDRRVDAREVGACKDRFCKHKAAA